jgi:hypothetical protein
MGSITVKHIELIVDQSVASDDLEFWAGPSGLSEVALAETGTGTIPEDEYNVVVTNITPLGESRPTPVADITLSDSLQTLTVSDIPVVDYYKQPNGGGTAVQVNITERRVYIKAHDSSEWRLAAILTDGTIGTVYINWNPDPLILQWMYSTDTVTWYNVTDVSTKTVLGDELTLDSISKLFAASIGSYLPGEANPECCQVEVNNNTSYAINSLKAFILTNNTDSNSPTIADCLQIANPTDAFTDKATLDAAADNFIVLGTSIAIGSSAGLYLRYKHDDLPLGTITSFIGITAELNT